MPSTDELLLGSCLLLYAAYSYRQGKLREDEIAPRFALFLAALSVLHIATSLFGLRWTSIVGLLYLILGLATYVLTREVYRERRGEVTSYFGGLALTAIGAETTLTTLMTATLRLGIPEWFTKLVESLAILALIVGIHVLVALVLDKRSHSWQGSKREI